MSAHITHTLDPRRTGLTLSAITMLLVVAHVVTVTAYFGDYIEGRYWQISIFDLDCEESFGTWFSSGILFLAGQLLLEQARRVVNDRTQRTRWYILAGGFHLLSLDEVVGLHEYLNSLLEETSWTTVGAVGAVFLVIFFSPFLVKLQARTRALFVVSGAIYLGGALGVERHTEWYDDHDLLNSVAYNLWNAVEEGFEMIGVVLFVYALLVMLSTTDAAPELEAGTA